MNRECFGELLKVGTDIMFYRCLGTGKVMERKYGDQPRVCPSCRRATWPLKMKPRKSDIRQHVVTTVQIYSPKFRRYVELHPKRMRR